MKEIRQYILGSLSESEAEQIEIQLLSNPVFAREVEIVYDQIVTDYLRGQLSASERTVFSQQVAQLPGIRARVTRQQALLNWVDQQRPVDARHPGWLRWGWLAIPAVLLLCWVWVRTNSTPTPIASVPLPATSTPLATSPPLPSVSPIPPVHRPAQVATVLFLPISVRKEGEIPTAKITKSGFLKLQIQLNEGGKTSLQIKNEKAQFKFAPIAKRHRNTYYAEVNLPTTAPSGVYEVHLSSADIRYFRISR